MAAKSAVVLGLALLAGTGAARADGDPFAAGPIHVVPAAQLMDKRVALHYGDGRAVIRFTATDKMADYIRGGMDMRLFRLDEDGKPIEYLPGEAGPCKVYMTRLYHLVPGQLKGTDFGPVSDRWLGIDKAGNFTPGAFKLVFEDRHDPNERSDGSSMFRLNKNDAAGYFGMAVDISVEIPDDSGWLGGTKSAVPERARREKEAADYAAHNPIPRNCYRLQSAGSGSLISDAAAPALMTCDAQTAPARMPIGGILQLDRNADRLL